jgi:hypothetical protein
MIFVIDGANTILLLTMQNLTPIEGFSIDLGKSSFQCSKLYDLQSSFHDFYTQLLELVLYQQEMGFFILNLLN